MVGPGPAIVFSVVDLRTSDRLDVSRVSRAAGFRQPTAGHVRTPSAFCRIPWLVQGPLPVPIDPGSTRMDVPTSFDLLLYFFKAVRRQCSEPTKGGDVPLR